MYYNYYYIQTNLICITILTVIAFGFFKKDFEKTSALVFKQLCIVTILFCIVDLLAGVWRGATFNGARTLLEIINGLYLWLGIFIAFLWLKFVIIRIDDNNTYQSKQLNIYLIPLIIMTVIILTNHWTNFLFRINEANLYVRNTGIILYFLVSCLYLIIPTYMIINKMLNSKNLVTDKNLSTLISFVIPPTITNILQFLIYGVTLNQVGITISILLVFLYNQRNQIILDELTGLNNRRELNSYLNSIIVSKKGQCLINLLMIDANHFKEINDNYGHIMGDKALVEIANSLKKACKLVSNDLFISRYGGDEFIVVGTNLKKEDIEKLEKLIREELNIVNSEKGNPYTLEVSIGYVEAYKEDIKSIGAFIAKADKKMYKEKQKIKSNNKITSIS